MNEENSIKELFTSSGPFDENLVVKVLKPLISINESNFDMFFLIEDMKVDDKILAFALAKRLLHTKQYKNESFISAVEVHKSTNLAKGSIDVSFKGLRERGYLVGKGRNYEINKSKISEIIEKLKNIVKVNSK